MRVIKFRGKRISDGVWIYGDLAKLMHEDSLCIMPDSFFGTRDFGEEDEKGNPKIENCLAIGGFYGVTTETVGQFTGLTDKNGKEIYEGDILKTKTGIASVIWSDASFALLSPGSEAVDWEGKLCYIRSEVIGNIHENSDLL